MGGTAMTEAQRRAAERFLPGAVRTRLRNPQVRPHWIGNTDRFWFRRETPTGTEFMVVDATTGAQSPAFDHSRLAVLIAEATGEEVAPGALPLVSLDLAGPGLRGELADGSSLHVPPDGEPVREAVPALRPGEAANPARTLAAFRRGHDLWLRDLRTGAERQLTTDGAAHHAWAKSPDMNLTTVSLRRRGIALAAVVLWSPDGRRLFTSRLDEREVLDLPLVQDVPDDGSVRPVLHVMKYVMSGDEAVATETFAVVDTHTGRVVPAHLPPAVAGVTTVVEDEKAWWSADGSRVFFLTRDRFWQRFTLHEMDADTGAVRDVYTETTDTFLDTNVSVLGLPNVRVLERSGAFLWFSQRSGWGHLYLHDLATGACLNAVTAGEWLVRDLLHVEEDAGDGAGGTAEFLAAGLLPGANPYHRTLCRVRLDGTGLEVLTPGGEEQLLAMPVKRAPRDHIRPPLDPGAWRAPSGRFFVHTRADLATLPVSELRRADGGLVSILATAEFDGDWRPPTPFTVTAADGETTLWGALWLPTGFDPARRYPVIDYIYPGPQRGMTPAVSLTDYMPELFRACIPQSFAELGFAVLNVDGRGTPLRSKPFQDLSYGRLHDPGTLADHVATLRELGGRHPFLDLSRVGIMGHSGGGYASVRALLDHPDVFHAAVATSGNHDQMAYSNAWTEKYQGPVKRHPGGGTSYSRAANPPDVSRLRGRLLLAHGDMDDNVHPALTTQLVAALVAADKDFEFVPLPGDDHTTVWNKPYFLRRAMDFMVRSLGA